MCAVKEVLKVAILGVLILWVAFYRRTLPKSTMLTEIMVQFSGLMSKSPDLMPKFPELMPKFSVRVNA